MLHLHSDIHVSFRDFYSIGYLPILSEKVPGVVIFLHRFLACILRRTAAVGAVVQRPLCGLSSGRN